MHAYFLRACLHACLLACVDACLCGCLLACLCGCLFICLFAGLRACLLACLCGCLLACLCACLLACVCTYLLVYRRVHGSQHLTLATIIRLLLAGQSPWSAGIETFESGETDCNTLTRVFALHGFTSVDVSACMLLCACVGFDSRSCCGIGETLYASALHHSLALPDLSATIGSATYCFTI